MDNGLLRALGKRCKERPHQHANRTGTASQHHAEMVIVLLSKRVGTAQSLCYVSTAPHGRLPFLCAVTSALKTPVASPTSVAEDCHAYPGPQCSAEDLLHSGVRSFR